LSKAAPDHDNFKYVSTKLPKQARPEGHGPLCEYLFDKTTCNIVVMDDLSNTAYFYAHVMGTRMCGKALGWNPKCKYPGLPPSKGVKHVTATEVILPFRANSSRENGNSTPRLF